VPRSRSVFSLGIFETPRLLLSLGSETGRCLWRLVAQIDDESKQPDNFLDRVQYVSSSLRPAFCSFEDRQASIQIGVPCKDLSCKSGFDAVAEEISSATHYAKLNKPGRMTPNITPSQGLHERTVNST
jgi:hypothetical protein